MKLIILFLITFPLLNNFFIFSFSERNQSGLYLINNNSSDMFSNIWDRIKEEDRSIIAGSLSAHQTTVSILLGISTFLLIFKILAGAIKELTIFVTMIIILCLLLITYGIVVSIFFPLFLYFFTFIILIIPCIIILYLNLRKQIQKDEERRFD